MAGHLYPKVIKGKTYYYYQESHRQKVDSNDHGKSRGSGKSRVYTKDIYLGTADSILHKLKTSEMPLEIRHREFGFVAAAYQTALETGLVSLLQDTIPGMRLGIPRWQFFLLPILNRLQHATSKRRMGDWAAATVLPDLLDFDPVRLNSKTFWYVTDDIICERELQERRIKQPELAEGLFVGLDDSTFRNIEDRLIQNLVRRGILSEDVFLYDTTNFFTYIEEPAVAQLAKTGHNKDCHHHCRQVGLALCVDQRWGIPLFHAVYRGNAHDSKTFAGLLDDLILRLYTQFQPEGMPVLVLDIGNNQAANFAHLQGKVHWVGSLVPSHFKDLLELPLEEYTGDAYPLRYYRCHREVFEIPCAVVVTYNAKLARKQEHTLQNNLDKLKQQIRDLWKTYKKIPKTVPVRIGHLLKTHRFGKFLAVTCLDGVPVFSETEAVAAQRQRFGKNLLFCGDLEAESGWIISQYHNKDRVENDFKLLKDPALIRWHPSRHWTDTKIRAYGFCFVMALVLLRVMMQKVERAGLRMSATVLKEELVDLKETVIVYSEQHAVRQISHRSTVQQRLWDLFKLGQIEKQLPYTN